MCMRYFLIFFSILLISGCANTFKCLQSNNKQIQEFANAEFRSLEPEKQHSSLQYTDQSIESNATDYPLYALLETQTTETNPTLEFREAALSQKITVDQRVNQLMKESISDYRVASDTVKADPDKYYEEAKLYGIISFSLSILSTILILNLFGAVFLPAFVMAIMSLKRYRLTKNKKYKILPIVSLIISGVWTIFLTMILVMFIIALSSGDILAP